MATDLFTVITKFDYETNTKELEKAYDILADNVKVINDNTASIERLEAVRAKTDKSNIERMAQLDRAISNRKRTIQDQINLIKAEVAANDNLRKSINQNISFLNNLTKTQTTFVNNQGKLVDSTNKSSIAVLNFNRVIQDAPFGILGIANNIDPLIQSFQALQRETGSTGSALKAMLSTLTGGAGLAVGVSVITSLLITFGGALFDSGKETKSATKELSDYDQAINQVASSVGNEVSELQKLIDTASNVNLTYIERGKAVDELQSKYPDYFGNLNREAILNGEVGATYRALTQDIINRAKATLQYNIIAKESENIASAQLELEKIRQRDGVFFGSDQAERDAINQAEGRIKMGEQRIKQAQRNIDAENSLGLTEAFWLDQNEKKQYEKSRQAGKEDALLTEAQRQERDKRAKQNESAGNKAVREAEREAKRIQKAYESALDEFKKYSIENEGEFNETLEKDLDNKAKEVAKLLGELKKSFDNQLALSLTDNTDSLNGGDSALNAELLNNDAINKKARKDKKEADAQRKKNRDSIIRSEQELQQTILGIIQETSNRQISLLDYELQIRQQRVQQATLLAQNGNAEILKAEQERLDKTLEAREKAAQKQQTINAIAAASNSALALTEAIKGILAAGATTAAEGGGVIGYIAGIVAAFAAVAGLYSSVRSLESFKDGVIGYQGKGNGTSDSNTVRISHGESIMTAQETKDYKPFLTAMREGNFHSKYLPMQHTVKNTPSNDSNLRKEFSLLRESFEKSGIKVKTAVSNGQIATIVERERKLSKRRFGE